MIEKVITEDEWACFPLSSVALQNRLPLKVNRAITSVKLFIVILIHYFHKRMRHESVHITYTKMYTELFKKEPLFLLLFIQNGFKTQKIKLIIIKNYITIKKTGIKLEITFSTKIKMIYKQIFRQQFSLPR